MSRDHWDAILASAPLNATAAAVTSRSKVAGPQVELCHEHTWEAPPALVKITPAMLAQPSFVDLTGRRSGRLLVLGMAVENPGNKKAGAVWVCRCTCGKYVGRHAKNLKSGKSVGCNACSYTDNLRYNGSSLIARQRAEAPEARKWKTPEELAAIAPSPAPESR